MTKQIPLSQGKFALVDDEDYEYLNQWKWYFNSTGYARRNELVTPSKVPRSYNSFNMHRIIIGAEGKVYVDHIDGNRINNQKINLRICTNGQNRSNSKKIKGKSKYKGVSLDKRSGKWYAAIRKNKILKHLGSFDTEIKAAMAYDRAAIILHGEYAKHNNTTGG